MNLKFALTALLSTAALTGSVVASDPAHAWPCAKDAPVTEVPTNPTNLQLDPPTVQSNLLNGNNTGKAGMGIAAIAALLGGGFFLKSRFAKSSVTPVAPVTQTEPEMVAETANQAPTLVEAEFMEPRLGLVLPPDALKPVKPLEETEEDVATLP